MSTTSAKGLGTSFGALLPEDFDESLLVDSSERIQKLPIEQVEPSDDQPRKHFDDTALEELASSIKQYGVLQPLVVTKKGDKYAIVAGERRWRASQIAGLKQVPAVVRTMEDLERLEVALIENVQRVDLSPLEQALSIERLHQQFSMSYNDIAARLGKAAPTVNNIVRLLQLPEEAKQALRENQISEGHARAILALKDSPEKQAELLNNIKQYGWSVRQAEQFVNSAKKGAKTSTTIQKHMATQTEQTKKLSDQIGAPVSIRRTAKGGKLEIHFKTDDELKKIIDDITS